MDGNSGRAAAWCVFVGPGPRLAVLPQLLGALRPDPTWEVRALGDVEELFGPIQSQGCLVLDCDQLDLEDLGFVRRFMDRNGGWDLILTGADSTARTSKRLMGQARARWMDWPLDVDQIASLWVPRTMPPHQGSVAPVAPSRPIPQVPPPGPARFTPRGLGLSGSVPGLGSDAPTANLEPILESAFEPADSAELSMIQSILAGQPEAHELPPGNSMEEGEGPRPAGDTSGSALPVYYRDQVADLADIAQRLQLSTMALQESAPVASGLEAQLQGIDQDVSRLLQFTRTLGYLAAPPATGDHRIDVGGLLEELLGSLAGSTTDAPRYLFRSAPGLIVRSDKMLLVQAFDAILQLATRCASADDVVRVAAHSQTPGPDAHQVEVRISFPAGPLSDLDPERILRPYALRRLLPSIGPNALAAAGGIVRGQGGALNLEEIEPGRLTWIVRFPMVVGQGLLDPT
ncbi:MAG: hypothetical protein ACI8QZ_002668 [Chlamydiales bacterium]|jgi:hypothetical protein